MNAPGAEPDLAGLRAATTQEALRLGFAKVGFTTAEPLGGTTERRWQRWLDADCAGAMSYLRRAYPRRTHPRDLLPEAQCVIVAVAGYYDGDHPSPPDAPGRGKIARYAWGRDYHRILRERMKLLGQYVASRAPEAGIGDSVRWRAFSDSAPLDERALAVRAGLGFIGKNTLLLDPERGSWSLLATLLISVPFAPSPVETGGTCGNCRRCLDACPTGALVDAHKLDPRKCISYLTIEQDEPIDPKLAANMNGWVFGCDICQEVCPFNDRPLFRAMPELAASEGAGPWLESEHLDRLTSKSAFAERWGHTPLERANPARLRRNLASLAPPPPSATIPSPED